MCQLAACQQCAEKQDLQTGEAAASQQQALCSEDGGSPVIDHHRHLQFVCVSWSAIEAVYPSSTSQFVIVSVQEH